MSRTISETVKPPPHPFYGDNYVRGLDPWHSDAFKGTGVDAGTTGQRNGGWFLQDAWGNDIAWCPDGTVIESDAAKITTTLEVVKN